MAKLFRSAVNTDFLKPFCYIMEFVCNDFLSYIKTLGDDRKIQIFNENHIRRIVYKDFVMMLVNKLSRVFILELNSARIRGVLQGNTSEERFKYYFNWLCDKENLIVLLKKYPVLNNQINNIIMQYQIVTKELFLRLYHDFNLIEKHFLGSRRKDWQLTDIKKSGDVHQQGRAVSFLEFTASDASKGVVIYKPRSTQTDAAYDEFIKWLNNYLTSRLLLPQHLYKENYGWFEVVKHKNVIQ